MNHFQITGWSIQTLALAGEKMLLLLNELASLDGDLLSKLIARILQP